MIKSFMIRVLVTFTCLVGQNNYPIVLIHGFMGWGSEEMGGYNYWGGIKDYAQMLRDEGSTVFTVSVGPVSSNWERAIEVYTQLKGGQVDYGKSHAKKFNIIQKPKGKVYDALYPQWDGNNPIHLIGHSQGGQTARMLLYLLTNKVYEDEEKGIVEKSKLLGGINENWIRSITAVVSPHDGTTLADVITKTIPFIQYFIGLAGVIGTRFYDFDLEQWGFYRGEDETWAAYLKRMRTHDAWTTKNICSWDLSLEGAKELNGFLQADPTVYYFSICAATTKKSLDSPSHIPLEGTSILTRSRAKILGSRVGYWGDGTSTDSTWFENDGIVNTRSMYGPTTGNNGPDPIITLDEGDLLIPGQWYVLGPFPLDHWNIIGHLGNRRTNQLSERIFVTHIKRLTNLSSF
tara:strand:- start:7539 stop:8747 length:1209 start_codon:yes stop_codon:yes gene_type:complete